MCDAIYCYTSYFKRGRKWPNKKKRLWSQRGLKGTIYEKESETCIRHWWNFESFALRPTFLVTFKAEHRGVRRARFLKVQEYFSFMIFLCKLLSRFRREGDFMYRFLWESNLRDGTRAEKRIQTIYNSREIYMHIAIYATWSLYIVKFNHYLTLWETICFASHLIFLFLSKLAVGRSRWISFVCARITLIKV